MAVSGGEVQRSDALVVAAIRVGTLVAYKQLRDVRHPLPCRVMQRAHPDAVRRRRIRSRVDERTHRRVLTPEGGQMKRCHPIDIRGVDVRAGLQQPSDGARRAQSDDIMQHRPALGHVIAEGVLDVRARSRRAAGEDVGP